MLKAAKEKQKITYKEIPQKLMPGILAETLQARRERQDIFKVMKEKNLQQDNSNQQRSHSDLMVK